MKKAVAQQRGLFRRTSAADSKGARVIRSCLDSLDTLLIRKDHRTFVHVSEPKVSSHGSMVLATTGKAGLRNAAYSIDHASLTIVSG